MRWACLKCAVGPRKPSFELLGNIASCAQSAQDETAFLYEEWAARGAGTHSRGRCAFANLFLRVPMAWDELSGFGLSNLSHLFWNPRLCAASARMQSFCDGWPAAPSPAFSCSASGSLYAAQTAPLASNLVAAAPAASAVRRWRLRLADLGRALAKAPTRLQTSLSSIGDAAKTSGRAGCGILGVSTAWFLAQAGACVVVVDRQDAPALETSFANGAQISVSFLSPGNSPTAPWKVAKWLLRADAPLLFRPQLDWRQWEWGCVSCASAQPRPSSEMCASWWHWGAFAADAAAGGGANRHRVRPSGVRHSAFLLQPEGTRSRRSRGGKF